MKIGRIAALLDCELKGSPDVEINGVAGIDEAEEDELTFVSNPKYLAKVETTGAGAIILAPDIPSPTIPTLVSDNPYLAFARAIELFYQPPAPVPGIHPTASIAEDAILGENHSIGPNVVISEGVRIGNGAVLHANVTIYPHVQIGDDFLAHSHVVIREYCQIGSRVILQNGAIVGADGFGFAPRQDGTFYKIVQSGIVVLEDDVELGAHTCIDRATVGETRIRKGTKIDNLVQVGHGSTVGQHSLLAAQTGLAGSTHVGNFVKLAGQVGAAGHLRIGDRVIATAQTGIARDVEDGQIISGTPEMNSSLWKRVYVLLQELPDLYRTVKKLQRDMESFSRAKKKK